jgi:uncharacterized coiled-coil DUF342 family protein
MTAVQRKELLELQIEREALLEKAAPLLAKRDALRAKIAELDEAYLEAKEAVVKATQPRLNELAKRIDTIEATHQAGLTEPARQAILAAIQAR